jgi:hypothetical protein
LGFNGKNYTYSGQSAGLRLEIYADGTWQIIPTNSGPTPTTYNDLTSWNTITGNWYSPTTPGIGSSYIYKIIPNSVTQVNDGLVGTSIPANAWVPFPATSETVAYVSITANGGDDAEGNFTFQVGQNITAPVILSTSTFTLHGYSGASPTTTTTTTTTAATTTTTTTAATTAAPGTTTTTTAAPTTTTTTTTAAPTTTTAAPTTTTTTTTAAPDYLGWVGGSPFSLLNDQPGASRVSVSLYFGNGGEIDGSGQNDSDGNNDTQSYLSGPSQWLSTITSGAGSNYEIKMSCTNKGDNRTRLTIGSSYTAGTLVGNGQTSSYFDMTGIWVVYDLDDSSFVGYDRTATGTIYIRNKSTLNEISMPYTIRVNSS